MNSTTKLLFILDQIENITKLVEGNEWECFYGSHLIPLYYETQRQLSLTKTQTSTKIKE
jgi:hypothetical protein